MGGWGRYGAVGGVWWVRGAPFSPFLAFFILYSLSFLPFLSSLPCLPFASLPFASLPFFPFISFDFLWPPLLSPRELAKPTAANQNHKHNNKRKQKTITAVTLPYRIPGYPVMAASPEIAKGGISGALLEFHPTSASLVVFTICDPHCSGRPPRVISGCQIRC